MSGKALTPWLLAAVVASLGTRAVEANRALLLNNARVGASLATALRDLRTDPGVPAPSQG